MAPDWPKPGPHFGAESVMRELAELRETWDGGDANEVISVIDVADRVVVRFIWPGSRGAVGARRSRRL